MPTSMKTITQCSVVRTSGSNSSWSSRTFQRKLHSSITRFKLLFPASHRSGLTRLIQIVSRNMTNLTPAQLEQFESTFRYFDKDETNTLNQFEMSAALASLGIVFPVSSAEVLMDQDLTSSCLQDEDLDIIYDELLQGYGAVTFEAFINLLVSPRVRFTVQAWAERCGRSASQRIRRRRNSSVTRLGSWRTTR